MSKKSEVHIPQFKQSCGIYGADDIGKTYVEIDMTNQHLYYYEDYSIKEISKILKTNENTVKSRLSRARKELEKDIKGGIENE